MLSRIKDCNAVYGNGHKTVLATGNAWIKDAESQNGASEIYSIARSRLASHFAVGTIDQLMSAVQQVRYNDLRLMMLAGMTAVIDEIHSSDDYMMQSVLTVMKYMKDYGSPVIALSATLADRTKRALLKPYLGAKKAMAVQFSQEYPLLTIVKGGDVRQIPIKGGNIRTKEYKIEIMPIKDDMIAVANLAVKMVRDGGNLLIGAGTTKRVKKLYSIIKEMAGKDAEVLLYHARTTQALRDRTAGLIMDKYGKDGKEKGLRPARSITIATTIASESLDVDWDYLMIDVMDMERIIQFAGRECRHDDKGTIREGKSFTPKIVILSPADGNITRYNCAPFSPALTKASLKILMDTDVIRIPQDLRPLINKERELAGDEYENEIISSIKNGENIIIKGPSKEEYTHSASYEGRRFPVTREEKYKTFEVIIVPDGTVFKNDIRECEKYLYENMVKVPESEIPDPVKERENAAGIPSLLAEKIVLYETEALRYGLKIDKEYGFLSPSDDYLLN